MFERIIQWMHPTPKEPQETSNEQLYRKLAHKCPECGQRADWFEGPRGGANINIFCSHCGQGYNICEAVEWAEKIHKDTRYIQA